MVDASQTPRLMGLDAVPERLLKTCSRTREARGLICVRPKLTRAHQSQEDVASSVLGKMR